MGVRRRKSGFDHREAGRPDEPERPTRKAGLRSYLPARRPPQADYVGADPRVCPGWEMDIIHWAHTQNGRGVLQYARNSNIA